MPAAHSIHRLTRPNFPENVALMKLDLEFVRAQFPAFAEASLKGQAFFENAGGSYTCAPVIDRLTRYYRARKVQPYSAYDASRIAGEEMDEARTRLAAMLGVETDELSFGPSTTQNVYVLAQAFREYLSAGDAIVVTNQDHEANAGAWRRLESAGVEVREWLIDPVSSTGGRNTLIFYQRWSVEHEVSSSHLLFGFAAG